MKTKYVLLSFGIICLSLMAYGISYAHPSAFDTQKLLELTNSDRSTKKLSPVVNSETLDLVAQLKLNDMLKNGYFAHTSPTGLDPWFFFHKASYTYIVAGENLALNFTNPVQLETAWMNSTSHRDNILNPKFTQIGFAYGQGTINGKEATIVVESLGLPSTAK